MTCARDCNSNTQTDTETDKPIATRRNLADLSKNKHNCQGIQMLRLFFKRSAIIIKADYLLLWQCFECFQARFIIRIKFLPASRSRYTRNVEAHWTLTAYSIHHEEETRLLLWMFSGPLYYTNKILACSTIKVYPKRWCTLNSDGIFNPSRSRHNVITDRVHQTLSPCCRV